MINHSTKSLPRRHKDVSQVPNSSCVLRGWFTVHTPGATFTWVVSGWIQKLGFLEMPSWQDKDDARQKSALPVKSCHIYICIQSDDGHAHSLPPSVAIMAIQSATCSINQTDCRFVYPSWWWWWWWGGWGWGVSETAVSVPASCSTPSSSVSSQPETDLHSHTFLNFAHWLSSSWRVFRWKLYLFTAVCYLSQLLYLCAGAASLCALVNLLQPPVYWTMGGCG